MIRNITQRPSNIKAKARTRLYFIYYHCSYLLVTSTSAIYEEELYEVILKRL